MRKPVLNQTTVVLAALIVVISIFLGVLRNTVETDPVDLERDEQLGAELFEDQGCFRCHYTDSTETRIGPGLKGLFDRDTLRFSDKPVTEENVKNQILDPVGDMPSFEDRMSEEELDQIILFLKTL